MKTKFNDLIAEFTFQQELNSNSTKFKGLNFNTSGQLTRKAYTDMMLGLIPDLMETCQKLCDTFNEISAPYSALQFTKVLQDLKSLDSLEEKRFLQNPETNHILIQNELLKVILIHWVPGKISSIHGHPTGGCVFKVLMGSVEELRYTTDPSPKLLSTSTYQAGGMAYIDDEMGYHAVGNPFNTPAISLHAYTPGIKK